MTDQPTPPLHEQVRTLEGQRDRYRDQLPDGYFRFMDLDFAARRGFPASPTDGDKHTARDRSVWRFDGEQWELREYAPDPAGLIEQVRTLEADLVMCREQLAQETDLGPDSLVKCTRSTDLARRVLGEMDELKAAVQDRDDALADVRRGAKEARADLAKARNVIEQVREHLWKSGPFIASDGEWSYRMVSREELLAILADEAERGEGS